MTETVFANAKIITEDTVLHGTMKIVDGVIAAIDSGAGVPSGAIDCEGDYIAPGLIELHTDNLERHLSPRPGSTGQSARQFWGMTENWPVLASPRFLMRFVLARKLIQKRKGYVKYARETADNILDLMRQRALKGFTLYPSTCRTMY